MYQWPRIVVTARWPPLWADGFNEVANSLLITPNILTRNDLNRSLIKSMVTLTESILTPPTPRLRPARRKALRPSFLFVNYHLFCVENSRRETKKKKSVN
jgi:hypothetical protein